MPRSGRSKRARRSSKRKRSPAGSESDNAAPPSSSAAVAGPLSFDAFLAMPEEIRSLILELAFNLPSPSSDASGSSGASITDLDAATTINLACTSRWFNVQATLRLYTHVAIIRPSSLASLQRAISNRPQLGRLIKSLHIGAWDPLPKSWYPVRLRAGFTDNNGEPHPTTTVISTSLRALSDLPEGFAPRQEWSFEHPELDRRSMAISRALLAAQSSLRVDLTRFTRWVSRYHQGQEVWVVQAALDLYLIAMRQIEDVKNRSQDHDASFDYPHLVIYDSRTHPRPSRTENACVLTRQQVLRQLTRPGGPTDRFDHPLLFARSGLDKRAKGYGNSVEERWQPDDQFVREPEDLADVFSSSGGLEHPQENSRISKEVLDPSLNSTATFGGLLALTRGLLAMTPRLENLSLTGFLERAVCGRRPIASALKSLRCLSIGPPPETSQWYTPLRFDGLEEIEKLRVCGVVLRGDEVEQIRNHYSEVRWSLADQLSEDQVKCLGILVDHLVGRKGKTPDSALRDLGFGQLGKLRLPFSYSAAREDPPEPEEEDDNAAKNYSGSFVELRLRTDVYKAMLARAATDRERTAWETGRRRPHQSRRLLLSEMVVEGTEPIDSAEALYKDGKEWWTRNQNLGEPRYQSHRRWPFY